MPDALTGALNDVIEGFRLAPLWTRLGWDQTLSRFRRTVLGPFWLSTNLLAISISLAVVWGGLMGVDYRTTFAHTICGMLVWGLISGGIGEGSGVFISSAGVMQSQKLPLTFHVCLVMFRLLINFAAQLITMWVVLSVMQLGSPPAWPLLLALPLVTLTVAFISMVVAFPATRYRDLAQLVGFMLQLLFFITPIFWVPSPASRHQMLIAKYNPIAHLVGVLRDPLLGVLPRRSDWEWSIATLVLAASLAVGVMALFRKRVVFWV